MGVLDDKLNSLTDSTLAGEGPADPDSILGAAFGPISKKQAAFTQADRDRIQALMAEYAKLEKILEPKDRAKMMENTWLCNYKLHNGKICNTLNGPIRYHARPRKVCIKCQQKRTNPRTFHEELTERNEANV